MTGSDLEAEGDAAEVGLLADRIESARIGPSEGPIRIRSDPIRSIRSYPRIMGPGLAGAHERRSPPEFII